MDIKLSTQQKVPVRLLDSTGAGVTGKSFGDVTVYIQPYDGSSAVKSLGAGDWVEVDAGNMPGVYDLVLSVADVSALGQFKYSVACSGATTYIGIVNVVENTLGETYAQADAAAVQSTLARKFVSNRLKVDTGANTLSLFDDDGVTVIFVWNLYDAAGAPTGTTIFERGAPTSV